MKTTIGKTEMSLNPFARFAMAVRMISSATPFVFIVLLGALSVSPVLQASEHIMPPGGDPCEADWMNRSDFRTVPLISDAQIIERYAERGDVGAQLRLGLLRRTQDGKWEAPEGSNYNIKWLQKAVDQGSKSAAWELARIQYPLGEISHEGFLRAAIAAAEEEGYPWAATYLMEETSGRLGINRKSTKCTVVKEGDTCAPESLLPISSAAKWARIAGEGGNAWAQEWLCVSASYGKPERGQPEDKDVAYKWCSIAAYNACSHISLHIKVPFADRTKPLDPVEEAYWKRALHKQPWRGSRNFYRPTDYFHGD